MKTKLLSKLVLISCTVVMIMGCGGEKKENPKKADTTAKDTIPLADPCLVCNEKDDHLIDFDSAAFLIQKFDSAFIKTGRVYNAGGIIDFGKSNDAVAFTSQYPTFKLHWAFDTVKNLKRLSITCEGSKKTCKDNVYDGKPGIEGPILYGTLVENDFKLKTKPSDSLSKREIITHLNCTTEFGIPKPGEQIIDTITALSLIEGFKKPSNNLISHYPLCDDIVFNSDHTFNEICAVTGRNALRYYFGYDTRAGIKHRLRIILVGINDKGMLVIYDKSEKLLMRETSRPRP